MTREELQRGVTLPRLTFRLPPDPSRLLRARERMRDYLQQYCSDQVAIDDVVLSVQEACTNAIRHSGSQEDIEVCLFAEEGDLVAEVRDAGHGFNVEAFDREAAPGPMSMGGRGLYLMAHVMDDLVFRHDGGLSVRMVKRSVVTTAAPVPAVEGGLARVGQHGESSPRQARLHVLLEEISEGFIALDWEYRITHLNTVAERLVGEARERLLNRDFWEALQLHGEVPDRACQDAMEVGRPSVVEHFFLRNRLWLEIRVYPTLAGISLYLREIDERKRAEDEHRLVDDRLRQKTEDLLERVRLDEVLLSVGQLIHSTLEIDEIMHRALDQTLLALHVDSGTVEMREGGAWLMRHQRGGGPGESGRRRTDAEMPVAARASLAGTTVTFADLLDDAFTVAFAREHDVRSCLAVPLIIRKKTVGCLVFWGRSPRVFATVEQEFAQKLAVSVSLAMENARLYEQETAAARLSDAPLPGLLWKVISRSQLHPVWVLLVSVALQAVFLTAIGSAEEVHSVYGIPGSIVALIVVITGALAGARMGALAAAAGGALFYVTVAGRGSVSSPMATMVSAGIWVVAALVAGYLAESLRAEVERRRAAAVALGKAAAVREAELAEQRRVESLVAELHIEREQLMTMIEQTETSIAILDRDFNCLAANSAFSRSAGREPGEPVGLNYFALHPSTKNEAIFRQARDAVEPIEYRAEPLEYPDQPERGTTYWDWRLAPVRDESGKARTLVLSQVDVTERVRSALLSEVLDAINTRVSSRLDVLHVQAAVLELAGEALAADGGWIAIKTHEGWRPSGVWNMPAEWETETFTAEELPWAEKALLEQHPVFTAAYGEDGRANLALGERLHTAALIAIPLTASDGMRGCLYFTYRARRRHSATEIAFARKVGAVLSQALQNARLLDDAQRVATALQENLIYPLGDFPGLDLGRVSQTAYHPELVGGDFSHVFPAGEGRVGVLIGDVEGKGIRAAGLTEIVRSAVVAFALVDPTPGYVLEKTNQLLLEGVGINQFVTACFLLVDLDSGETSYAIAGHPAPVLLRASSCESLSGVPGLPLGAFPGVYDVGRVKLACGDCLILLTDGVTEARCHGELFGEQRVLTTVRGLSGMAAQDVAESLREAASQFARELRDDLQILTVRYTRKGT
ncbi:MAG TPA: SpoIIE family protein phosphatase [Thermoleophilia bacterium]|nr:SpoIIE family protein phosphatase [Thermoleophilia bacterium]